MTSRDWVSMRVKRARTTISTVQSGDDPDYPEFDWIENKPTRRWASSRMARS